MMRSKNAASTTTYAAIGPSRYHWQTGGWQHFPWKGLGALLLSLAGVIVSVAILLASNGDDVRQWKFQPTVYLSIASTITNISHTYALWEGITVAWWHKALKDGTNVGDLHRFWAFGNSFLSAILAGRYFNLIALACILVAISPVNGPLLQRASTITNGTVSAQQDFQLQVNHLVNQGSTAIVTTRGDIVNMLTTEFGFHTNCSSYQLPYDMTARTPVEDTRSTIFGAEIAFSVRDDPTTATLNVAYKPKAGCVGKLSVTNCTLRAGTVQYPIVIDGPTSTVTLDPNSTIWDDVAVGNPDYLPDETHLSAQSEAAIAYSQNVGTYPSCNISFTDPLADFLQGTRELIFRTAVYTANSSNTQQVQAVASGSHTIYRTDWLFLGLATFVSLLAIVSVLLTFRGFWNLGRPVSMSPIETAKAFNAPLLANGDPNAPANHLLKQVGLKPVKYGVVNDVRGGSESAISTEGSFYRDSPYGDHVPDTAYSPHILRRHSTYRNHQQPGSDFELLTPGENAVPANTRLELADPKRVTPL
ncbi:hypothetical protein H2200_002828 [Cladophialophora chaetospira]|uniref:Uncharacterized protein n=1 Tax=Cladophialophora chaetospira TaxID=386627 RepID=A0AA38XGA6_9EURO|nr:hypothetical protein H2200_002828 [Cladophialophora chaetospira]